MKRITILRACAAISLAAGTAVAQVPASPAVPAPAAVQPGAPATAPPQPVPAARWTADQIRQSFELADSNSDGQISRGEAQRLSIMPRPFEEMDQNKDGVLVRSEYEAGFAR